MTLAQRLLFAIAAVTIATAAAAGFALRKAWRDVEEQRFAAEHRAALEQVQKSLRHELSRIRPVVELLCQHDTIVDSALVGLESRDLEARRLSFSLRVSELSKALELDELYLITAHGEILGASDASAVGRRDPALAARVGKQGDATVRDGEPLAVEFACRKRSPRSKAWVGLYAARHLGPLLREIGESFDVELARAPPPLDQPVLSEALAVKELGNVRVWASRSRVPMLTVLRRLDATLVAIGSAAVALALLVAVLLARGLARPIVELSRQAREVVSGEPKPVAGGGGREIDEFAESFNRAIADLAQLRKRLAAAERIAARREIARRVAHEIKNPLAPIRAAVETLRRLRARNDPAFDEYFDEATRTVLDEVARIANIVSEFTRFARLPPPNPAPMDLVEAARSVVSLHAGSGSRLRLDAPARAEVVADRDQIVQVLTNLIQNALDAVSTTPEPEVVVELRAKGDRVTLVVRDNGPGFADEVREHLFEPYFTTKKDGTGLGLAIVQRIVVEHGGDLSLSDTPGGGASLLVELPAKGPPAVPERESLVTASVAPSRPG